MQKPAPLFTVGQLVTSFRKEPAIVRSVIAVAEPGKSHRVTVSWLVPHPTIGAAFAVETTDPTPYYETVFESVEWSGPGWWDGVVGPFVLATAHGYVGVDDNGDINGRATRAQAFNYDLLVDAADVAIEFNATVILANEEV